MSSCCRVKSRNVRRRIIWRGTFSKIHGNSLEKSFTKGSSREEFSRLLSCLQFLFRGRILVNKIPSSLSME